MQQVNTSAYRQDTLWRYIISGCGLALIVLTIAIGAFLCYKGLGTFTTYNHSISEFLFSADWAPSDSAEGGGKVGAAIFIFGSVITCALALAIATPFSLATAIFMTEISPELGKRFVQPAVEIFVGIPSVVYGWIGLTILVPLIKNIFNLRFGFSVLAAGIVLAVMIFPTITSLAADALRSIPKSYRAASYGLGATRWQTIAKVVVPAAVTGLMTAVILGLARAFGEALAVAMVIGKMRAFPTSLLSPTNNLTAAIAADMGGAMEGSEYNIALWTMALLLFIISSGFKLAYLGMGIYESRFAQYASYINISTFSDPGDILYMVITFVLIPAVCEELIYRSVIFGEYMRDGYGTVIAAAASTVLYALLHTGLQRLPLYLIIGAMLCIVVRITGSVLMSMVTSVVFGLCDVFTENYISALAHSDYKALVVFTVISLFLLFAVLFFAEAERLYFVLGTSGEKPPARSMREGDIKQLLRSALLSPTVIVCAAVYAVGIVISLI